MGSRSMEKAERAIEKLHQECPESANTVEALQVDLDSDQSIEAALEKVKADPGRIDALINNAGATFDLEYVGGRVSLRDCFMNAYNVNVAGTNVLTWTFMPLLLKSSDPRLLFITGLANATQASRSFFPTPPQPVSSLDPRKIVPLLTYSLSLLYQKRYMLTEIRRPDGRRTLTLRRSGTAVAKVL